MEDENVTEAKANPPPLPTVRCKFVVTSLYKQDNSGNSSVSMYPVIDGSPENKEFWEFTPAGLLNLQVTNDSLDHFEVGDEYYIDIIPALNAAPLYPDPIAEMDKDDPQFEKQLQSNLSFGDAINYLQLGMKLCREGWNGRGIFIELQSPDQNSKMTSPYIFIDTTGLQTENEAAPKSRVPWLASQTDMLSFDWMVVE